MNLTAASDREEIFLRHILDALTLLPHLSPDDGPLLDIGTGAGLPGIPLKIARPAMPVFLLEVSRKKVSFLKATIRRLGLSSTEVLHGRAEAFMASGDYAGSFSTLVSRAAVKLPQLLYFAQHFLAPGGRLLAMKGDLPGDEAEGARKACDNFSFLLKKEVLSPLPFSEQPKKILHYEFTSKIK